MGPAQRRKPAGASGHRRGLVRMADFQSTFERLELKYLIDERSVEAIRAAIAPYCRRDSHGFGRGELGYRIDSVYLDSPSLAFFRAWEDNQPHRLKLRVRSYSGDGPVHLEIKEKHRDVILKTRVSVARDGVVDAAHGFGAPVQDVPRNRERVDRFAAIAATTGAEPRLLVRYHREAYQSHLDGYARVTFDRKLMARTVDGWNAWNDMDRWSEAEDWRSLDDCWNLDGLHSPVVLELKCERQMPAWMAGLVQDLCLQREGFSKYATGIRITELVDRGLDVPAGMRMAN